MCYREELGWIIAGCDWEQVCSGRMKVCQDGNIFQMGASAQFDLWSSVFVLSLISVIYPCKTVCAGTRASVSQVLLMALEPVSCLLPLVCLILCLPSCLSMYPVILSATPRSLSSCFTSYLPVSLLDCLSASFNWEVLLNGEVRNGRHSTQLLGGRGRR